MAASTFRDLNVWRKAHALFLDVYRVTQSFPREEMFGLTSQLRRAMTSIPANICEGFVKRGVSDKLRFYNIAQGSLEECRYYFILAHDLGFTDTNVLLERVDEVSRMLEAYCGSIKSNRRRLSSLIFWLLAPGSWLLAHSQS
jgi:four helix bundle protein